MYLFSVLYFSTSIIFISVSNNFSAINSVLPLELSKIITSSTIGKYKENKFYLFNNQEYHTIINFDKNRIIFTVEFEKNKDELKYEDLLKYVKFGL